MQAAVFSGSDAKSMPTVITFPNCRSGIVDASTSVVSVQALPVRLGPAALSRIIAGTMLLPLMRYEHDGRQPAEYRFQVLPKYFSNHSAS